jgi:hypothetical protein
MLKVFSPRGYCGESKSDPPETGSLPPSNHFGLCMREETTANVKVREFKCKSVNSIVL